jgi:hypothetical protein
VDSFILRACGDDPEVDNGKAWLVDPLLDLTKMRKFSGTLEAGKNSDFVGKTCDAFAHFTLIDSNLEFVPADIQGNPLTILSISIVKRYSPSAQELIPLSSRMGSKVPTLSCFSTSWHIGKYQDCFSPLSLLTIQI